MPLTTLTHSPADVLRWLLVLLGQGTDPGNGEAWPCYASNEPGLPDDCITVTDTAGQDDGRSMHDGEPLTHHGFQVRVRAVSHASGWLKADALRHALAESFYDAHVNVGGSSYLVHCCSRFGQVLPIGVDNPKSKRSVFTFNALVSLSQYS